MPIAFIMLLSSCSFFSVKTTGLENKLIGIWILDSTLSEGNNFFKKPVKEKAILIFKDESNYSFEYTRDDSGSKEKGLYFVHKNPNRGLNTIVFIPDLVVHSKDTIRRYMNFDVISISDTSLKVILESQPTNSDKLPFFFSEQHVFKLRK